MRLYCRLVSIFDEKIMNEFANDHINHNTLIKAGDCSLMTNKSYHDFDNFYDWYKCICKFMNEENLEEGQVGCSCFLVFKKDDDSLIGIFDIRHSLNFLNGNIYGHIGVDVCPSERNKGYYTEILELIVDQVGSFGINPLVISCEYDNIYSKRGIEHVFDDGKMIQYDGSYFYIYKKEI